MPDRKHDEKLSAEIPPENNIYYVILHQHFRLNEEEHRGDWVRAEDILKFERLDPPPLPASCKIFHNFHCASEEFVIHSTADTKIISQIIKT